MERENGLFDYEVEGKENDDIRIAVNDVIKEHGWNIMMMSIGTMNLEDIFLKITMGEDVVRTPDSPSENKKGGDK